MPSPLPSNSDSKPTSPLKLLLVAGARPNFMKLAPLVHCIERHNAALLNTVNGDSQSSVLNPPSSAVSAFSPQSSSLNIQHSASVEPPSPPRSGRGQGEVSTQSRPIDFKLVHTGQHYDAQMSQVFFDELGIPKPDFNLEVGSGSHAAQAAEIMKRFEPVLQNAFSQRTEGQGAQSSDKVPSQKESPLLLVRGEGKGEESSPSPILNPPSSFSEPASPLPDWVVVFGDVNSTMACTLVAVKMGIRVAHVEAGLRSFDRTMPEEINRIVTDSIADLLLTPSEDANENLRREGVPDSRICLVGNIMIDSLVNHLAKSADDAILRKFDLEAGRFIYVTLHRPSNVDCSESLGVIVRELSAIAGEWPVIFPIHPRTRKRLQEFGLSFDDKPGVKLVDPIGYNDSISLTRHARCVLTDSGGLQEESTFFRTPCLTLRPNTERPVTVTLGSNRLTNTKGLCSDFEKTLRSPDRIGQIPPLWDGKTSERIVDALLKQQRCVSSHVPNFNPTLDFRS